MIDATKPGEKPAYMWDDGKGSVPGFGLQILPSGIRSFVFQYRTSGQSRRMTIGRYPEWTVDEARKEASRHKVTADRGGDPLADRQQDKATKRAERLGMTIADLMDRYLERHVKIRNAASTRNAVEDLIKRHIVPKIGKIRIRDFERKDATEFHFLMRATPRQANFTLAILSKAFNLAEEWGLRPENSNPCKKVSRYPEPHRERFLTDAELERLGEALIEAETIGLPWKPPPAGKPVSKHVAREENRRARLSWQAIAAIRLLLFTGARLSEAIGLAWKDVNLEDGMISFPGVKGGARRPYPASIDAIDLLKTLPRKPGAEFVFPRDRDPKRHLSKEVMETAWQRIRWRAGLEDVHLHDLRHTTGTYAAQAGISSFVVRDLLRHRNVMTTGRYANYAADPVRDAADRVSSRIAEGLSRNRQKPEANEP